MVRQQIKQMKYLNYYWQLIKVLEMALITNYKFTALKNHFNQ